VTIFQTKFRLSIPSRLTLGKGHPANKIISLWLPSNLNTVKWTLIHSKVSNIKIRFISLWWSLRCCYWIFTSSCKNHLLSISVDTYLLEMC